MLPLAVTSPRLSLAVAVSQPLLLMTLTVLRSIGQVCIYIYTYSRVLLYWNLSVFLMIRQIKSTV